MNMQSLFPKRLAISAFILTLTVICGLVFALWRSNQFLEFMHEVHFPALQLNGIILRLHERLESEIKLASLANKKQLKKITEEHTVLSGVLMATIVDFENLNKNVESFNVSVYPRNYINAIDTKILAALKEGNHKKAAKLMKDSTYQADLREFSHSFQFAAENLSKQLDLILEKNSAALYLSFIVLVINVTLASFLWYLVISAYYENYSLRKHTEEELEQERLISFQSSKLASLGEMAGGIAHEINNPMAIIEGYARTLRKLSQREKLDSERVETISGKIEATVKRVTKIIQGMKGFVRNTSSDPYAPIHVSEILDEAFEMAISKIKQNNIVLRRDKEKENFIIDCRKFEISQVVLNLVSNACDAIANQKEPWIQILVKERNENIEISVVDSGTGIPREIQEKILTPFFTTKEVGKGTGLGLSICRTILTRMDGELYINNNSPNTCFVLSMPKEQKQKDTFEEAA